VERFDDFNVGDAVVYNPFSREDATLVRATVTAKTKTTITVSTGKKFGQRLAEWGTAGDNWNRTYLYKWSEEWAQRVENARQQHYKGALVRRLTHMPWNGLPVALLEEVIDFIETHATDQ
jgi:hypothetical protein